ncbi:MAG: hypothetical protein ACM65K_01510 [Microcoleus sp.]
MQNTDAPRRWASVALSIKLNTVEGFVKYVIDIASVSQGKDFSDFITKFLCFPIQFSLQIQESLRVLLSQFIFAEFDSENN